MKNNPLLKHFENVGLLITHYNRSQSLERLLKAFQNLNISFGEVVVSDDGSEPDCVDNIRKQQEVYGFKLITTPKNKGLGNNINKGQQNVTKPFTLYVQEDFVPTPYFFENFDHALSIIQRDEKFDIIRFYAYFKHPYTKQYDDRFDEMLFSTSLLKPNHLKFYVYSDHPHLRRTNFIEKFRPYREELGVDKTEFAMCLSFLKRKGRGLQIKNINLMFDQLNSEEEPSTTTRAEWINKKKLIPIVLREIYIKYRSLKNTIQYLR
ncbi:MAG: glycosyltransferase, partial [Pedobacter sp.]